MPADPPLLAEDVLLLLLDPVSGTTPMGAPVRTVLGGALLADLALGGHVRRPERSGVVRRAKVQVATSLSPPADPLLRAALEQAAAKERTASDLVHRLGKQVERSLGERLVARGVLERRDERVLGLFPRTRWPAADARHEDRLRRDLRAVLVEGARPEPRTGSLVALLAAVDRAHRVVDHEGLSGREVKRRAKQVAEGDWVARAVRDAVAAASSAAG